MSNTYRVSRPIYAARVGEQDTGGIVSIDEGVLVELLGPAGVPGFVEIRWRGEGYSVFEEDLKDRCIKVLDAAV